MHPSGRPEERRRVNHDPQFVLCAIFHGACGAGMRVVLFFTVRAVRVLRACVARGACGGGVRVLWLKLIAAQMVVVRHLSE